MKKKSLGLWLSLFLFFVINGTAVSQSSQFWAFCSSNEHCKNGGLCSHHSCVCAFGYTGPKCESKLQCSSSLRCSNNGTCELDVNTNKKFCSCNKHSASDGRFEGVFCERKAPCHAIGYCLSGGVCQRDPYVTDSFFCKCREGFTGPDCKETTSCHRPGDCRNRASCVNNRCSCNGKSGYTGHFCELEVTPGAAKVVKNPQMGNVISLSRAAGDWVDLGPFDSSCLKDLNSCQQGISMSFWLQFSDGLNVIALTNNNSTILSVQVKEYKNIVIHLTAGPKFWQIKRSCFPVGWFHLTITWDRQNLLYYENGRLLLESTPPSRVKMISPADSSHLSVGGIKGQGGFSTMMMSDLALWTHVLSREEVTDIYKKKLLSPLTSRCLPSPCSSSQWCEDEGGNLNNFTCIAPKGFYCSFDNGSCQWRSASSNNNYWTIFIEYGSLLHDHTNKSCTASGRFLGLVSKGVAPVGQVRSDVISRTFPKPSVPGQNVSISMWYYMEEWTSKTLYVVLKTSAESKTVFVKEQRQSRRWKYIKVEVLVNETFQVILRGELNGSGGIFVDDISVETFSSPVILPWKTSYLASLHNTSSFVCAVYDAFNITWYRNSHPVQQDKHYTIYGDLRGNKKVSTLKVTDTNCQVAGNYTCVTMNAYGSDQRQFTLSILDVPQPPSRVMVDSKTKQIRWTKVPGYECLPKSHFVVEYKKHKAVTWATAGYFDNGIFDLLNASKGEKYDIRIFAKNSIGRSPTSGIITFWTNIKPSEIQLFVNKTAVKNSQRIFLQRGKRVDLKCEVKAEPMPLFTWIVPLVHNLSFYKQHRVGGIKWKVTLRVRSMSCLNSGTFSCLPRNMLGSQGSASVTFAVIEPDPPKTFSVAFINITSVIISWSASKCNGASPRKMLVLYRQQGSSVWNETVYKSPVNELVLTRQFQYKTVYEFSSRIAYGGRLSEHSSIIQMLSPELKLLLYNMSLKILSKVYSPQLADSHSEEFAQLSKNISTLILRAVSHLPDPKHANVTSFEGPGNTTANVQFSIAYPNNLQLQRVLRIFIRDNNKRNGSLIIDADSLTITLEPECKHPLGMENGAISDQQVNASSKLNNNYAAHFGRLHLKASGYKIGGWVAGTNDVNQWLQIDLIGQHTRVSCIATQGRNGANQWVTRYKLQYSTDGVDFNYYSERGQTNEKEFAGNTDRDTVVYHKLDPPIRARFIRFRPVAWFGLISMRVELYDMPLAIDLANVTITSNFSGQVDTTMTIYCTADTSTALSFSWTRDNVTLQPSYRVKFDVSGKSSVLTIRMTRKADSGNYTCKVSNSKRSLRETISVSVSEAPRVNIRPLVRTLFEGDSVTLHCGLSRGNISQLHVTWYAKAEKDHEKLISDNNDSFSLTLRGSLTLGMERNVYLYRCNVRNIDGVSSSPSAKLVMLRKGDKAVCTSDVLHGVTWSVTSAGMIEIQQCPDASGQAKRRCLKTGPEAAEWGEIDFSDCISFQIRQIHDEVLAVTQGYKVSTTLSHVLEDLQNATASYSASSAGEKPSPMYEKDLSASVDALTKLIRFNAAHSEKPLSNEHDIDNLVKTSSNLLKLSNLPTWKTALKAEDDLAYQLISALDEYGHHSTNKTGGIHIDADNVVLIAVKVTANISASTKSLQITHGQNSLNLPSTFFSQRNTSVTIVSVIFSTLGEILTNTEALTKLNTSYSNGSDWFLNSRIASITVRPRPPDVIKPPFKLALETNEVAIAGNKRACVFLNLTTKHNNVWSTEGCSLVSSRTNSTTTSCVCNHMTLFAVLMDTNGDTITDAADRAALSWISIVGCIMSLAGIFVTLLVMFCFWKNLRSPRTVVLVNLCVAMAVTDVLIVAMEMADLQNKTGCKVLAVLLHFFVLSIFCWMLSEGVQLYFSLVKIIGPTAYTNMILFYALGWGLPAVVIALSLAATQGRGYADMQSCWLSTRNHVIWAFVAPALLIVSVNTVVFALVIYNMLSSHRLRKEPLTKRFQRGLKASFVLLPLLGISWFFGVLTMTTDKIVFNYIFATCNSLQGFFIFMFHCVGNKQVREVLTERRRKRTGFVTDAMATQSNCRKLSTVTNTTRATPLKLLGLELFKAEITPSPQPSPTSNSKRAFEETSLASASLVSPRVERGHLLRKKPKENIVKNREAANHMEGVIKTDEPFKPCDMDERDWTSLESSFESIIDCSGDEDRADKPVSHKVNSR